jgi:hypothetical protein
MLSQWFWIMVCYDEPVFVNRGELCWASCCEYWCVILSQWLWIMVCYSEPVVVNHGEYTIIHNNWLSITHHDSQILAHPSTPWFIEPVVVNHGVLCWDSCCESCCVILSQWLWIMMSYAEPVVVNDGVLFWASGYESWCVIHHASQPLAQHNTPWYMTTGSA